MTSKPLVSVIVPVYNVESYLSNCIESILSQTYANTEVVLVDDGSTDGSGLLCDDFAKKDKRVIVVHKSNGGLVSARQAGVKASSGLYIMHVDGDDWIDPNHVSNLVNYAEKWSCDIVSCDFSKYEDGLLVPFSNKPTSLDPTQIIQDCLLGRIHAGIVFRLIKKTIYIDNQISFPPCDFNEDLHHLLSLLSFAKKTGHVSEATYHYRINESSMTQNQEPKAVVRKFKEYSLNMLDLLNNSKLGFRQKERTLIVANINSRKRDFIIRTCDKGIDISSALIALNKSYSIKEARNIGDFFFWFASRWCIIWPYCLKVKYSRK